MDEPQLEIVREGEMAKALLESEAFVTTVADLKQVWINEHFQTNPDDADRREELYRLNLALQHVEAVLASRIIAMEAIHAVEAEENNEE